jgi:pimeloyl-ACP methyl ester carboxylesterase
MNAEGGATGAAEQEVKYVAMRDGRRLGYSEYGVPDGKPVLYFHGHPGSRLDLGMFGIENLKQYGLRIIAPDRPGMGRSDFQPNRRIVDWPADVADLSNALGIQRFAVIGISGGGPFAAVTAHAMPNQVTKLVLASSVGRFEIPGATQGMGPGLMYFRMGRYFPWLVTLQLRLMATGINKDPQKMAQQVTMGLPPSDVAAMTQPGVFDAFLLSLAEFLRQGPRGPAQEAGFYLRPWGFSVEKIHTPTFLWHGEADRNAPIAMGRDLASRIPGCVAKFIPGEGHFSLLKNHTGEILGL